MHSSHSRSKVNLRLKKLISLPALAFLVLSSAWGSSYLWIKLALEELDPLSLITWRLTFGVLGLLVVLFLKSPKYERSSLKFKPASKQLWILVTLSTFAVTVPFFLLSWGENHIQSGLTGILVGLVPVFASVFAHFLLPQEKFNLRKFGGLLAALCGVSVLLYKEDMFTIQNGFLGGSLAVTGAALSYAFANVSIKKFVRGFDPIVQAFITLCIPLAIFWGINIIRGDFLIPTKTLTWISVGWLGLVGSSLGYILYFFLLKTWGASRTSYVNLLAPLMSVSLGCVFLGEPLSLQFIAGSALVLLGLRWSLQ